MAANRGITDDMRTNRVLYRANRERVLTRTQIRHVRGTDALIALMVERGWLEAVPDSERDEFALTPTGALAMAERVANGNYATC